MKHILVLIGVAAMMIAPPAPVAARSFPVSIPLPVGSYPEGIALGRGHQFYVGSLLSGAIYKGDLRTGQGEVFASGVQGRVVVGMSFDRRSGLLWGVGFDATGSRAFVFDGRSGEQLAEIEITDPFPSSFLNDLVVTRDAVYITDSLRDVIWSVPLDRRGRPAGPARAISLSGDFTFVSGTNLNGITATADGRQLVAVHSTLGMLYRIDPRTGTATEIDLGADAVPTGDGIELHGHTLYVVQNFRNQVAVIHLAGDLSSGTVVDHLSHPAFRVPTTIDRVSGRLYLPNARFGIPNADTAAFQVVGLGKQ